MIAIKIGQSEHAVKLHGLSGNDAGHVILHGRENYSGSDVRLELTPGVLVYLVAFTNAHSEENAWSGGFRCGAVAVGLGVLAIQLLIKALS